MDTGMTLVIGGARSGKSSFAQALAAEDGGRVCYVATAEPRDAEMAERIRLHRESRPPEWSMVELTAAGTMPDIPEGSDILLLDCFTVYLSNLMALHGLDWPVEEEDLLPEREALECMRRVEELALEMVEELCRRAHKVIVVSNEVGMGVVPAFRLGRIFRDLSGRLSRALAERAGRVYLVTAGLPLRLKPHAFD